MNYIFLKIFFISYWLNL